MKIRLVPAVALLLLVCPLLGVAQDKGTWHAVSNTANSITGDIAISDAKLMINFTSFPLAHIRSLQAAEISAVFDAALDAGGSGNLYRLNINGAQKFLHRNTLCGSEDTQWMVTFVEGKSLQVAFFSGADTPVLKPEAVMNSQNVCGTFSYVR
jgi:hypothetical protein